MKYLNVLGVTLLALISGCSLLEDRSDRYMDAEREAPLIVPEFYATENFQDRYPVPKADKSFVAVKEFRVPPPPEPGFELLEDQFIVEQLEQDVWLLVSEPPARVWPALRMYWQAQGGELVERDSATGKMQVQFSANSKKASDYLERMGLADNSGGGWTVAVGQGLKRRSSEIRLDHAAEIPAVLSKVTRVRILEDLKDFLSERRESLASYSLGAQAIESEGRIELVVEENSAPHLSVRVSFARTWYEVGEALTSAGIPVVDIDRTKGVYYVDFEPGREGKKANTFFSWLTSDSDGMSLSDQFNFQILVQESGEGAKVLAQPKEAGAENDYNIRLLNRLLEHMS